MRLRTLLRNTGISTGIILFVTLAAAASNPPDPPAEANSIFREIQSDAEQALYHADRLQAQARSYDVGWEAEGSELDYLKVEINDIGARLHRLEAIRGDVSAWQQQEIDRIQLSAQLMAANAQDAITFGNTHPKALWLRAFQTDVTNLFNEAQSLTRNVNQAVQFPAVSKEYRELQQEVGERPAQ